ncbi:sugar phosphate isomerase/epimerase family protein [Wenjunlia tyrosinilytica]|uniref:Epimerase n=1 Tax=Wenjunlia tyrosinilytica TaxID=1544741 RepID=A0A917ZV14_9ACTN|nr:sugar phosphate isomerase/epimerase family protein [Wenjunlia tyrosinilytica]GGO93436.1 epimerase [Wenjunlia tyrosinilytica]
MTMRLSMHNWMRPEPLEVTIPRLARCGYDAIEISADPHGNDLAAVGRLLAEHKISCAGGLALFMGSRDLVHEYSFIRQAGLAYLMETIDLTAELGGTFVTVPCTVGKLVPMAGAELEWDWYVKALREAQKHAGDRGVRLAIEPLTRYETYLINRADQALRLAEEVGEDCGVCLDIFHMNIEEADWRSAIRSCAGRLVNVHVAENNGLPPGSGAIDWAAVLGELVAVGYDGHLSVEFMPAIDRTPVSDRHIADEPLSQGMIKWMRDHASGVLPADLYEDYTAQSARVLRDHLTQVSAGN